MTIGIDARLWNETGVGRYIRQLFLWLPKLDTKNNYVWFFNSKTYDSIEMPYPNWKKVRCDIRWHTFAEQIILPVVFLRENLDLLHFPYFTFPVLYPKKFVITIHDLIYDHYKTGKGSTLPLPLFWLKKLGYIVVNLISIRRALAIFTLSNDAKIEIIDHYRANPAKVHPIYESGEFENIKITTTSEMKKLQPYVLYVGNAHPHKNVENLIKAAEIGKFHLVLVGNDPFFYPRLPKSKSVTLIGHVDNSQIAGWFKNALCLVSASQMEGFGIPPLEAMGIGCPVILSNIPVFHEINADAAVYFDQNNPQNMAEVILETLANKKKLQDMIKKGYQRVKMFSWEKMVIQTHQIYENCLGL